MSNFTNSALATIRGTNHSKINGSNTNRVVPYARRITKITIHHTAGVINGAALLNWGHNPRCGASWNYGIGNDGVIGLMTEERHRAWTSGSAENDYQAVTIEVSNSAAGGDWPVGTKAYNALLDLCTDICRRNGIGRLTFDGTKNGSLTHHSIFQTTNCPGKYLLDRFPQICDEVNKGLEGLEPEKEIKIGDIVRFQNGRTTYYPGGPALPAFVKTGDPHIITQEFSGGKPVIKGAARCVLLGKRVNLATGKVSAGVNTWAAVDFLELAQAKEVPTKTDATAA